MPLTTGAVTIKTAAGNYSSWAAFWDDLGNLTGDITCTVDASAFTENSAPAVVTENLGGFTLHVLPASFPTTTDANTGARFTFNYTGDTFSCQVEGPGAVTVEGIVFIKGSSIPAHFVYVAIISTDFTLMLRRNIFKEAGVGIDIQDVDLTGMKIYNNIIINIETSLRIGQLISGLVLANNTVVGSTYRGIGLTNKAVTATNNLSYDNTTDFASIGSATGNNNAASDATGEDADWSSGSNNIASISDPFIDYANKLLGLSAGGISAIGSAGVDLSGNFTDDFFGTTRTTWSIGAVENGGPSGGPEGLVGSWSLAEDNLFLGPELVVNGDMELDSDWDNQASPAANVRSDEQAHSGIYSRKITLNGIGSFGGISSADEITFVVGKSYIITGWAYNLNMSNGERLVMDCTQFSAGAFSIYPNQGVWAQWSAVVVATATSRKILFYNYPTDVANANASFYVDDVSIKEIYFTDLSGNGNNLVSIGATTPSFTPNQQGRADRANIFDRSLSYFLRGVDSSDYSIDTTNEFFISQWVKFETGLAIGTNNLRYIFSAKEQIGKGEWKFYKQRSGIDNNIHFWILDNAGAQIALVTTTTLFDNAKAGIWYNIMVAIDYPNSGKIYINNVLDNTTTTFVNPGNYTNNTAPLEIGRSGIDISYMDGDMCNVQIYNNIPTDAERTNIYESELFWNPIEISSNMDFGGNLSAQSPDWLLIPDFLNWRGDWAAGLTYNELDVVLYMVGTAPHAFVSKTSHNIGNIPPDKYVNWTRLVQGKWREE